MSNAETTHSEISLAMEIEHPAEPPTGVALFALRKGQCKYPLGGMFEPASRFCGCDAPIGSPYCAAHRASLPPFPARRPLGSPRASDASGLQAGDCGRRDLRRKVRASDCAKDGNKRSLCTNH